MAIRNYVCSKTGKVFFDAYIHFKSSIDPKIRVQKFKRCETELEAQKAEKILIKIASQKLKEAELRGTLWSVVVHRWEVEAKELKRNPTTLKPMSDSSRETCLSLINTWTKGWMSKPCKELSIKDGKDLLMAATAEDLKPSSIRKLKTYVNLVFRYGVQEGIIEGVKNSPVHGVPFDLNDGDYFPEILTAEQAKKLLSEARVRKHPWFHIWATALMTGMRSSELFALRKENVDLKEGIIRVCESWDRANEVAKGTKAGYWRNAPIAQDLKPILLEAMEHDQNSLFVFPRHADWVTCEQAQVLRDFCVLIGVPSVRFHTLRACFATHLLGLGVDAGTIMAIGGWSNYKTFRIYIRLAGLTEKRKTEDLAKLLIPSMDLLDSVATNKVVHLETYRNIEK